MPADRLDFLRDDQDGLGADIGETFDQSERDEWHWNWPLWARAAQLPPEGDWRVWLVMAGRGFGKTRAGAEWVRTIAEADHEARIAMVGASLHEARAVMVEGESGVMAVCPPHRRPRFEPSLRRVIWPNGAQAMLYSAGEPESLRGPQHSHACGAGAEGSDGQRKPAPAGRPGAHGGGGRNRDAAGNAGKRAGLARGDGRNGRFQRA